ncbi:hypothetical protein L9F63_021189, partial [Diploptera punctata]
ILTVVLLSIRIKCPTHVNLLICIISSDELRRALHVGAGMYCKLLYFYISVGQY